jgi:hypothetical protein
MPIPRQTIPDAAFAVDFSLDGQPPRLQPELTEKEVLALGYVTCQWAFLEHALFVDTLERAARLKSPIPTDVKNTSFARRLRAWRSLTQGSRVRKVERERLSRLHNKIANLEKKRHQITHGLWSWDYKAPHRLTAYSFRPNVQFIAPFDADKIWHLGDKIGEVNFAFVYPGGKAHAYKALLKDRQRRGSFVSRSWLLRLQDRSPKSR